LANPQTTAPEKSERGKKHGTAGSARVSPDGALDLGTSAAVAKGESLGKVLLQLGGFMVVLCIIGAGYYVWAKSAGKIYEVLKETRDIQRQDDYESLKKARAKLDEGLKVREEGRLVSLLAETNVLLWCVHGDESAKDDAIRYTEKAEKDDVVRSERYSAVAYLMTCQGKSDEAERYITRTIQKGAGDSRIWHALGVALMAQGRVAEAKEAFKQAADKGAGNPRFPTALADAELRMGNYFDALQQYARGANSNGSHIRARVGKLLAEGLGGVDPERVVRDLVRAIKGPPPPSPGDRAFGMYALAEILARTGDISEAVQALGNQKDAPAQLLRGKIQLLKGEKDAAIKSFEEAAKKEPMNPGVYLLPATLLVEFGLAEAAMARLQAYQKQKLLENVAFQAVQGEVLENLGKPEDAAKVYAAVLDKDENNVRAILGTGRLLIAKKSWEEAGALLEKVTQIQPDNGDPWHVMAGAYILQKDYGYAAQMADKAAELFRKRNAEPRFLAQALRQAAKAYELDKNKKEAEARNKAAETYEKYR
jgi:tetratricopeptide (TPR) repeat protein